MTFIKRFSKYKCPNCHEDTISYLQKLNLSDYRYLHQCKECGGEIKLPVWSYIIFGIELLVIFYVNYKLNLVNIQALLFTVCSLAFIWLIQFPFIPVISGSKQVYPMNRAKRKQ